MTQPTISRHLDILRRAGFIKVHKQQKWSYCTRDDKAIGATSTGFVGRL